MIDHSAAHEFARVHGFYPRQVWWIDTFTLHHGHYYRWHIAGTNGWNHGESISWRIPNLCGTYAFRLRVIA